MPAAGAGAATWRGLALDGLASFRHPDAPSTHSDALVVGYAAPSDAAYSAALDALCSVLPPA